MRVEYTSDGIFLPDIDLWLDARKPVAATWISHGHADHATGGHGTVIATPQTLDFHRIRISEQPETRVPLEYGASMSWNTSRLSVFPAGHILGAAQLLIEHGDHRLLYTGDIKRLPPICGETTVPTQCTRLIIESTFGLPVFHFLTRESACEKITAFARECFEDGAIPAFLGYPLGRGQEIAWALQQAGVPMMIHGAIARFLSSYSAAGFAIRDFEPYLNKPSKGKALIVVPGVRDYLEASGKNVRIAYVSGWAALSNGRARARAEHLIPYSDHGGFNELLGIVQASGALHIDVVHGYAAALAHILRQRGLVASAPGVAAEPDHLQE